MFDNPIFMQYYISDDYSDGLANINDPLTTNADKDYIHTLKIWTKMMSFSDLLFNFAWNLVLILNVLDIFKGLQSSFTMFSMVCIAIFSLCVLIDMLNGSSIVYRIAFVAVNRKTAF